MQAVAESQRAEMNSTTKSFVTRHLNDQIFYMTTASCQHCSCIVRICGKAIVVLLISSELIATTAHLLLEVGNDKLQTDVTSNVAFLLHFGVGRAVR